MLHTPTGLFLLDHKTLSSQPSYRSLHTPSKRKGKQEGKIPDPESLKGIQEAALLLKVKAEAGDSEAQLLLGKMYYRGDKVKENKEVRSSSALLIGERKPSNFSLKPLTEEMKKLSTLWAPCTRTVYRLSVTSAKLSSI